MAYCRYCGHKFTLMECCKRHIDGTDINKFYYKIYCNNNYFMVI